MDDPRHVEGSAVGADDGVADGGVLASDGKTSPAVDAWHQRIWPRLHAGPLVAVMMELIDWLVTQGYAPSTQRNHVRAAARLGSWTIAEYLKLGDLNAQHAFRMVRHDSELHPAHRSANENASAVLRVLRETGRLGVAPEIHAQPYPAEACSGGTAERFPRT